MSNENWTPEPWGATIDLGSKSPIAEVGYIFIVAPDNADPHENQLEDDANLIAAAPELYEALKDIAYAYRETFGLDGAYDPALRAAEHALAKARGDHQ